ncbi:MAG: LptF/LptG family permease, partial [Acetobacter sp.]|nr:LptF/LptG family permease [Acetobacter sp.]
MSHYVLLRYLSIALITRVLLCSAAIAGLLELLSLLEQTTPILQRHLGLWGVFYYAILRFPFLISNALPPGMLIGTLFMLTQMTFSSEIPTLRAAGMSSFTLYKYLIPATLVIGFFGFFLTDQIIPHSELTYYIWWNKTDRDQHGQKADADTVDDLAADGDRTGGVVGSHENAGEHHAAGAHILQRPFQAAVTGMPAEKAHQKDGADDGQRDTPADDLAGDQVGRARENGEGADFADAAGNRAEEALGEGKGHRRVAVHIAEGRGGGHAVDHD